VQVDPWDGANHDDRGRGTLDSQPSEQGCTRLEVADYLGVTQQRVSRLASSGGFPRRGWWCRRLWKRSVVERWAASHWWGTRAWRVPNDG